MSRNRPKLDTDGQIDKLQRAATIAERAAKSDDVAQRLGAVVLYAGAADYLIIQAARLVEQVVLKGQLAVGRPKFRPSDDSHFYDRRISSGRILKGIRKLLPFGSPDSASSPEADRITRLATRMIDAGFAFLDYRNPLLHQIGNPERTFDEVMAMSSEAISAFATFREAHKQFFEAAGPYRFSEKELEYFYGPKTSG